MSLFEMQKITLYANGINYSADKLNPRQPSSQLYDEKNPFAEHVPCTISRISQGLQNTLILLISSKNVKKYLPSLPTRGFKVKVESLEDDKYSNTVDYLIDKDAYWPAGIRHHIECELKEYN